MEPEITSLPQQEKLISIKRAIFYGILFINGPVLLLLFGIPAISIFSLGAFQTSPSIIIIGLVAGFVLAWTWWSFATPRWRIWAMLRVDNIYLLHQAAVNAQITWPRGHLFEHTEIKTQIQDLQQKHIETRDLINRFRYYIDYQIAGKNTKQNQFEHLQRCLVHFCVAAYSENKKELEIGTLNFSINQLRIALKSARMVSDDEEWKTIVNLILRRIDDYQDAIKTQLS